MRAFLTKLAPFIVLILAIILFFPKAAFQNHTFVASGQVRSDLYTFNYPIKQLLHQSLLASQNFPYWSDLMGGGYPVFAEGQVGGLYPLHLLFFSIPLQTFQVFNLNLFTAYALGGILAYLYLQQVAKLQKYPAIFGGLVFMLCGWMISFLQHINTVAVALYFPLDLLLIEKIFSLGKEGQRKKYYQQLLLWNSALAGALFLQVSLGHVESAYHNFLFTGIYFLVRLTLNKSMREHLVSKVIAVLIAGSVAILLFAPQLLATLELTKLSTRESAITDEASTEIDWPIHSLTLFINPKAYPIYIDIFPRVNGKVIDYAMVYGYIGLIPLVLIAVSSIIIIKNKSASLRVLRGHYLSVVICSVITVLYLIGGNTQFFTIVRNTVPGLSFFRYPIKALYILEFYLAVVASFGFQVILNYAKTKQPANSHKLAVPAIAIVIIGLSYLDLRINNQWIQPTLPADYWLERPSSLKYLDTLSKDCHCSDPKQIPFQNWRLRANQVEIKGTQDILNWSIQKDLLNTPHVNMNVVQNVMLNESYSGLPLERQTRLNSVPNSLDTAAEEIVLPAHRKRVLKLQSVKYVISDIRFRDPDLTLIKEFIYKQPYKHLLYLGSGNSKDYIQTDRAYLYENNDFAPRIQLIPQQNAIKVSAEDKKAENIFNAVLDEKFDLTRQVIIEDDGVPQEANFATNLETAESSYSIKSYSQEQLNVSIKTDKPVYFVISDNYYPGWYSEVDGQPVEIQKANFAYRAVAIPAGEHQLKMYYQPTYMKQGVLLFSGGAALLVTAVSIALFLSKRSKPAPGIITP